jgi:hypothetical protein
MTETEILLVEDNAADARLTAIALEDAQLKHKIVLVRDGSEALEYFYPAGDTNPRHGGARAQGGVPRFKNAQGKRQRSARPTKAGRAHPENSGGDVHLFAGTPRH